MADVVPLHDEETGAEAEALFLELSNDVSISIVAPAGGLEHLGDEGIAAMLELAARKLTGVAEH
ncbi:MAG: hypothetical protein ACQEUZ_06225 [Pseudomonadota bacterium]